MLLSLLLSFAHATPTTPCGLTPTELPTLRITSVRGVAGDGDAWEIMLAVSNWTTSDATGIEFALSSASTVQQGGPPQLVGADSDANGRPFGAASAPLLGNTPRVQDWSVVEQSSTRVRFGGSPLSVATDGVAQGPYDPSISSCASTLPILIPGSTVLGDTLQTDPNTHDDGDNVLDGIVLRIDDLDPGEAIALDWVIHHDDGIAGYRDEDGLLHGDAMGFGAVAVAVFVGGHAPQPVFGTPFDPGTAFDPHADSPFLWAEDEIAGVDTYPIHPIPGGFPSAGSYLGMATLETETIPLADPADAEHSFEGGQVTMSTSAPATGASMTLDAPRYVLPGEILTLEVAGVQPGDDVWFLWGTREGSGPCPPVLGGDCVDVRRGVPLGRADADADGMATLSTTVPTTVPFDTAIVLQAVALRPGAHVRSTVHPVTVGYDPAIPCPVVGDDDGDEVCNDVDLCEGDDALGDPDMDGTCGVTEPPDPCESSRGCVEFVATNTVNRGPLQGPGLHLRVGFQGTVDTCFSGPAFGGYLRAGTSPGETPVAHFVSEDPAAQAYLDLYENAVTDASYNAWYSGIRATNNVTIVTPGFTVEATTNYTWDPCFTTWGPRQFTSAQESIRGAGTNTVGDIFFRWD